MKIGDYKYLFERWRNYLGIVSLLLAIRMNVIISPIPVWWFVVGFVVSIGVSFFDFKYILRRENSAGLKYNDEFQEMKKMVKEIYERTK